MGLGAWNSLLFQLSSWNSAIRAVKLEASAPAPREPPVSRESPAREPSRESTRSRSREPAGREGEAKSREADLRAGGLVGADEVEFEIRRFVWGSVNSKWSGAGGCTFVHVSATKRLFPMESRSRLLGFDPHALNLQKHQRNPKNPPAPVSSS